MNSQRQVSRADSADDTAISRRSVLAAGGIVVVGGLSGCLDRVASAATNTGASPAAVFAGRSGDGDATTLGNPRVTRLTPALSVGSGALSGEVELEGWITSLSVMAQNHNSSRSNRTRGIQAPDVDADSDGDGVGDGTEGSRANYNNTRSNKAGIARPPDILDDDLDEDDETVRVVSRLDTELLEATETAWRSISKRSARTGRNPELDSEISAALESMAGTLSRMRAELERCSDDVCRVALENVAAREADVERAQEYAAEGEWAAFGVPDEDAAILTGEYLLPPVIFDAPGTSTLGERAELFRYLDGEMMVGERFTVCLPDAEVPGGNGSIREAVTPKRFIDYMTGRSEPIDGIPLVFDFGAAPDPDGDSGCAVNNVTGEVMCWSPHLSAAISGIVSSGGSLGAVRADDGTLVVMSTRSTEEDGPSVLVCPAEGEAYEPANLQGYGTLGGDVSRAMDRQGRIQDTIVAQVMVQPPGCPQPVPALFYVGRGESDGQLVYSGGWVIDDSALYGTASTVLTTVGSALVVGIDLDHLDSDSDGDGIPETLELAARPIRGRVRYNARGARLDTGPADELVEEGVITAAVKKGYDYYKAQADTSARTQEADKKGGTWVVTHLALDAPVLHLTNAGSASNEVKFKAGAALSGQVN